ARRDLLQVGLQTPKESVAQLANVFLAVATEGLALLASDPREPVLLNTVGVALYELGAYAGDKALFEAAHRLDPQLPHTAARLRELTGRTWREAFFLVETNHTGDIEDGTAVHHNALRVFRNRPEYRFTGRIHEQIAHTLPGHVVERIETTDIRLEHFGYLGV